MEDIYILGSGGFAKEVYFLIKSLDKFNVIAFIDKENKEDIIFTEKSVPVISENDFLNTQQSKDTSLAIGLGDPKIIDKLSKKFKDYKFPNLIHPTATLDIDNIQFGKGNIVTGGVVMTTHIRIGNFNIFNLNTTIGHDVIIGDNNIFNPTVNISGEVKIGNNNLFGVASVVLQQKTIDDNNILGASSLLTKNMVSDEIWVGVPAKPMNK